MLLRTEAVQPRLAREWLVGSPFESCVNSYIQSLTDRGYLPGPVGHYFSSVGHFAHWCSQHNIEPPAVNEQLVERFMRQHLPACRCAARCMRRRHIVKTALALLLNSLRSSGTILRRALIAPDAIGTELGAFDRHLRQVCGLTEWTCRVYLRDVKRFLAYFFRHKPVHISGLAPRDIVQFMQKQTTSNGWKPATIKAVKGSIRSYLAFKAILGVDTARLSAAFPKVARWRLSQLPKMVSAEEIERLLGAYDRATPTGKRDYAIARCLIDLGLRRSEVARLTLDDVDWRDGVLRIPAKGRQVDVLPLPDSTGRAIVDYLRGGRPKTTRRELFVRHNAPHDVPIDLDVVRSAIRCAAARCGLQDRVRGTHILRHTVAGRLVQAGTPLKEIADLLRHRDLNTTTIYAKVDLPALTRVALPWPGKGA